MSLWRMILTAVNLVGFRLGGAAMGLVSQILLARLLPQEDVGVVLMSMSAAAIISLLMTAGYPSLTMTVVPRYIALGRTGLERGFRNALWHDTIWASLALAAICTAAYLWAPVSDGMRQALLFGALMSPASSLIRITSSFANSRRLFNLSYVPDFLFRPGMLFVFLLAMLLLRESPGLGTVLWVVVGSTWAVAIGQAIAVGRGIFPEALARGRRSLAPFFRGRAAAMVLIAAVVMAFADIVTLIGGAFLPAHDVAQLGIAIRLAALAGFVTQVTQNFVLPDLSEALVAGQRRSVRKIILRSNLITMSAIGACVLVVLVAGPLILAIFGPDYQGARWPLVLFMVSQLFRAAGGLNQHLLSLDGYQTRSVWACVTSVMLLIAASSLLAPRFGLEGVAVAVLLAEACWAMVLGLQAQRYAGYRGDIFANFRFHSEPAE